MSFVYINTYFDKVYVVTLKRAKERQQTFSEIFKGLNYSFYFGQDKNEFTVAGLKHKGIYDEKLTRKFHRYGKNMSPGQIGCAWSHLLIYEDIVKHQFEKVLILEDDSYPITDNLVHLPAVIDCLPQDWELLFFDYFRNEKREPLKQYWYHFLHSIGALKWNHAMIKNLYPTKLNTHISKAGYQQFTNAYAITKKGAATLIKLQKPIHFIADHVIPYAITNELLKGYISHPKIFAQDSTGNNKNQVSYVDD